MHEIGGPVGRSAPNAKPGKSVADWRTGGDVDLTKNTKERLAYYESLEDRPSTS
jgi:hypothetical protein